MFKKILVAVISFSLAYSPIAMALGSSQSGVPVGWSRVVGEFGYDAWVGPGKLSPGGSISGGQAIWNSATKGAVTVTTSAKLAVATGEAALVVKGVATGANIFAAAKLLTMGGMGPVGIGLTALTMAPMVVDYFKTDKTRLGSLAARESDKPFELQKQVEVPCNGDCSLFYWDTATQEIFPTLPTACSNYARAEGVRTGLGADTLTGALRGTLCVPVHAPSGNEFQATQILSKQGLTKLTSQWFPASMDDIAPYMDAPSKVTTPAMLEELVKQGAAVPLSYTPSDLADYFPPGTLSQPVTGPASVTGAPTVTTSNKDGKTTKVTETPRSDLKYSTVPDAVGSLLPKVTATPGNSSVTTVTDDATGVTTTTGTTDQTKPAEKQSITCGLPDTPACKIDETGTKTDKGSAFDQSKTDIDTFKDQAKTAIDSAQTITAPSWTFSFQLPTGCAPYATGLRGFIMNICPYQSTIHDLLSMIWAASTAFALIGMVGRTIRET